MVLSKLLGAPFIKFELVLICSKLTYKFRTFVKLTGLSPIHVPEVNHTLFKPSSRPSKVSSWFVNTIFQRLQEQLLELTHWHG